MPALLRFEPARVIDEVRGIPARREEPPVLHVLVVRLPPVGKHFETRLAEEPENEEIGRRSFDGFHHERGLENLVEESISSARACRLGIELVQGSNEAVVPTHDPPRALDVERMVAPPPRKTFEDGEDVAWVRPYLGAAAQYRNIGLPSTWRIFGRYSSAS